MPKIFEAKKYITRDDLEAAIRAEVGMDSADNRKVGHIISGTLEEMKDLGVSDTTEIFGCRGVITDEPTSKVLEKKLNERNKNV